MKTYIAILRGINVSGHNKIKMDELRTLFESLHFNNVKSYIQSGNVVFQYKTTAHRQLEKHISKKIVEGYGFNVPVLVKDKDELQNVVKNNPFVKKRNADITKLHVTFLSGEPDPITIEKIKLGQYKPDEFIVSDNVIYLFCPNGYGNTKLTNNFFESKLKLAATTRNWKTINELISISGV